jgi:two-component system sensor histidine kinase AlgZ
VLVVLAELLALLIIALQRGLYPMDWEYFSLLSLFSVLNFLSCAALRCCAHCVPRLHGCPCPRLSWLYTRSCWFWLPRSHWRRSGCCRPLRSPWNLRQLLINVFAAAAVVVGIGVRYLYFSWQLRVRECSELGARIQALQSRIRPHFLFNSLNTVACLVAEDGAKAERAVEDLSALFPASLQDSQVMSCWADERDLCERYLRIEVERLGDLLRVEWHIDEVGDKTPMLSLSLQPLIENAISHGIQHLPQGGDIQISAQVHAELLHITLSNPQAPEATVHGNQLACTNLHHRLQAIYSGRARLELSERERRFVVELQIPVQVG